ncbi:DUF1641 domain-containing protein [Alicyclobacillus sp. SO9]|uniref:DUF1641 domain-containing protein n=1 Tax=Alicyclobacillus sp. SO9 TaxID=2665646 RepID=UPI0018E8DA05|nr:DUF1641 domain-containing protein [Alicyclobacillus sp. SO9]QQE79024.1 DUF1641 domain-containing protein [Alicyclobacillus sp. SO9]
MASPSTSIHREQPNEAELLSQSLQELTVTLTQHSSAIVSLLKLVAELEESGVLQTLTALLKAKNEVLAVALEQITKPGTVNAIENLLSVVQAVQKVDGKQVQSVLQALTQGLEVGHAHLKEKPEVGVFDLVRALRDPAVSRSMSLVLGGLKGFGEGLGTA